VSYQRIGSGAPWEPVVGYSRAVRAGRVVEISGTAPVVDGDVVAPGDAYTQAKVCLQIIERVLGEAGATLSDVVRTRIFVTDISRWQDYGRAHGEVFGDIRPATSMVEVSRLIDERMLVEIEATAWIEADLGTEDEP
jgi:enamine deaminase RidA (YjgF/YER057c/UK114 family)